MKKSTERAAWIAGLAAFVIVAGGIAVAAVGGGVKKTPRPIPPEPPPPGPRPPPPGPPPPPPPGPPPPPNPPPPNPPPPKPPPPPTPPPPAPAPDYSLSLSQPSITAPVGSATNFNVSVVPVNGYNSPVALSTPMLPGGTTVNFNPGHATPQVPSFATVYAGNVPGSYSIEIDGTDGKNDRKTILSLTVT